ncbi:hypothetical protein [Flectobacillus major]|uniref:hypothetical protein n=1 Tax=Flectobacillus major TaxID=103 RepID=UPI0004291700|nr:hypothetical protein [Flectobacillus major]
MNGYIGKQGKKLRSERIKVLLAEVRVSRKWKRAFVERFPVFDSIEGSTILSQGAGGRSDDPTLLECAEQFVMWVKDTQPDWYTEALNKKQANEQD